MLHRGSGEGLCDQEDRRYSGFSVPIWIWSCRENQIETVGVSTGTKTNCCGRGHRHRVPHLDGYNVYVVADLRWPPTATSSYQVYLKTSSSIWVGGHLRGAVPALPKGRSMVRYQVLTSGYVIWTAHKVDSKLPGWLHVPGENQRQRLGLLQRLFH